MRTLHSVNSPSNAYGGGRTELELLQRAEEEERRLGTQFTIPVQLDIVSSLALAGSLQLALRHPEHVGIAAVVSRQVIDGIRNALHHAGYVAHAGIVDLGDSPERRKRG